MKELIYNNSKWELAKHKVVVSEEEKFENDLTFYNDYKKIYPDFVFMATELVYTDAQLRRLEAANKLKADNSKYDEIYEYIINGNFDAASETFAMLKPAQNRADIDYMAMETGVEL